MRRFHRSAAEVKMCRSARLNTLGAEAEERSDEAHDAVLGDAPRHSWKDSRSHGWRRLFFRIG